MTRDAIHYAWRGEFDNAELNALHAEAFTHALLDDDWRDQVERHSLGWVCARQTGACGFTTTPAGLIAL